MSEIEIGNYNNEDILKYLDTWKFIRDYFPTAVISVEKLRQWGRTLANELELEIDDNDNFAADDDLTGEEQGLNCSTHSVPNWSKWFGYQPSASDLDEAEYFNEYMHICHKIEGFNKENLHFHNILRPTSQRTLWTSEFKTDGCLVQKATVTENRLATTDILAVIQCKKDNTDDTVLDNRSKVVSAVTHTMLDDVRRMFMYAITVEDCWMTVWYFARDHCARTTFNWWKHKATMISVFLSLMCARKEDLGIDPRISLCPVQINAPMQFIYELENGKQTRYYRTERLISGSRNLRIAGRNTRVFEVVEVDSKSDDAVHEDRKRQVLKDAWIDADELTESEIQERMFRDIQRFVNSSEVEHHERLSAWVQGGKIIEPLASYLRGPDPKDFRSLFLCIALESTGPSLRKKRGNYLRAPKSVPVQHDGILLTSRCQSGSVSTNKCDRKAILSGPVIPKPPRLHPAKKRTFIIFNEICKPVHALPDVGTAFHVLADAVIALLLMHCGEWVHRDISSGNVMAIYNHDTKQWETKLGDLEYAKKITDKTTNVDSKTGTPYFMAAEILRNSYFTQVGPIDRRSLIDDVDQYLSGVHQDQEPQHTVVVHNFYHDVECIFWIAYWLVTCRVGHQPSLEYVAPVFSFDTEPNAYRDIALSHPLDRAFQNHLRKELRELVLPLDKLREILYVDLSQQNWEQSWDTICDKNYHITTYMILNFLSMPGKTWCKLQDTKSSASYNQEISQGRGQATAAVSVASNRPKGTKRGWVHDQANTDESAKKKLKHDDIPRPLESSMN